MDWNNGVVYRGHCRGFHFLESALFTPSLVMVGIQNHPRKEYTVAANEGTCPTPGIVTIMMQHLLEWMSPLLTWNYK